MTGMYLLGLAALIVGGSSLFVLFIGGALHDSRERHVHEALIRRGEIERAEAAALEREILDSLDRSLTIVRSWSV